MIVCVRLVCRLDHTADGAIAVPLAVPSNRREKAIPLLRDRGLVRTRAQKSAPKRPAFQLLTVRFMRRGVFNRASVCWLCAGILAGGVMVRAAIPHVATYRVEKPGADLPSLRARFSESQLALLEKLNRADVDHLAGLPALVVPESWLSDELEYSILPAVYRPSQKAAKALVAHLPMQAFGAYESGRLVRWGPLSSGARDRPTPPGLFNLNWRSAGHTSTLNPDWFMRWYFNFGNREGLAFHQYTLPGLPASHGCVRLLERDAQWLFAWGEPWTVDDGGLRVIHAGTPVLIVGHYEFDKTPPWREPLRLAQLVELPTFPGEW
jgi:L,D-transpeptidase-like protein